MLQYQTKIHRGMCNSASVTSLFVRLCLCERERGACVLALPIGLLAASGFGLQSTNIVVLGPRLDDKKV
jgi:hypothetical protein